MPPGRRSIRWMRVRSRLKLVETVNDTAAPSLFQVLGRDTYGIGSAALLAAWCGLLANSVFIDTLHWRHLWLVAGLIWAAQVSSSAGTRPLR